MPVSWESRNSAKSRSKQLRRRQREEEQTDGINDLSQGSIDHEIPLGNAPLALKNLAV
jgi:hypothetical protein